MDLPLTPGGLHLAIYGTTHEYQHWLKKEPGARFHNPPLLVDLEQGTGLFFGECEVELIFWIQLIDEPNRIFCC